MIKLKTIVVDDERLARRLLSANLNDIAGIEVVAECENGRQALMSIYEHCPDLIFLDIEMPGMNGFDVVKALQPESMPMIIFTTAYDRYAVAAFDVHAIDYLLKPLEETMVERAVQRAITHYSSKNALKDVKQHLLEALDQIGYHSVSPATQSVIAKPSEERTNHYSDTLCIKDAGDISLVSMSEIDWIDAAGDYMCVHSNSVTHVMRTTMNELTEQLDPDIFKRIHRSTLVNMRKIERACPHTKGAYFVYLRCGTQLKVSRSYGRIIKQFIASAMS
jgi:two-component system LytT family response regulator